MIYQTLGGVMDTLRDIFSWLIDNPSELLWMILPAVAVFIFALVKILQILAIRRADVNMIIELAEYQTLAISENHDAKQRMNEYIIRLKSEKNVVKFLLIKYLFSHYDFNNILSHFTYPEYIKVKQSLSQYKSRAKMWTWILVPFVVLFILFGAAVSFAYHTALFNDFATANVGRAIIIPAIILAFFLATIIIIALYNISVRKYKTLLLEELQSNADEFFEPITPLYDEFALRLIEEFGLHKYDLDVIKRLIHKEGMQFRQGFLDLQNGVQIAEEEAVEEIVDDLASQIDVRNEEIAQLEAQLLALANARTELDGQLETVDQIISNEDTEIDEVVEEVAEETQQAESVAIVENIDDVFAKFEEQGATQAVAPLLQEPVHKFTNTGIEPGPVVIMQPSPSVAYQAKPMVYKVPEFNPWTSSHTPTAVPASVQQPTTTQIMRPMPTQPPRPLEEPLFVDENPIQLIQPHQTAPVSQSVHPNQPHVTNIYVNSAQPESKSEIEPEVVVKPVEVNPVPIVIEEVKPKKPRIKRIKARTKEYDIEIK